MEQVARLSLSSSSWGTCVKNKKSLIIFLKYANCKEVMRLRLMMWCTKQIDMKCQGISVVVTLCSTRTYDYQHWDPSVSVGFRTIFFSNQSFLSLPHPRFSQLRLLPCWQEKEQVGPGSQQDACRTFSFLVVAYEETRVRGLSRTEVLSLCQKGICQTRWRQNV